MGERRGKRGSLGGTQGAVVRFGWQGGYFVADVFGVTGRDFALKLSLYRYCAALVPRWKGLAQKKKKKKKGQRAE